jgi:predicted TIM-barrel fold metal-dependent hydrolase
MIVDIHSHYWRFPDDFGDDFLQQAKRAKAGGEVDLSVRYEDYMRQASEPVTAVVFGGKARLSNLWVNDKTIADYVNKHKNLVGFLSVDPTQDGSYRELREGHEELGLKGLKLLPMYAGFKPNDPLLDPIWRYCQRNGLPVLLHAGTTFVSQAPLACTIPSLVDDVATRFPGVKIILAHLGHPYEGDCIVTIRKHPNVYADISALHYRPFQFYNALMLVQEYGVWNKLLFGTDYPFTTVDSTLKTLRGYDSLVEGTNLPRLNQKAIEEMIYRDTLKVLGIKK